MKCKILFCSLLLLLLSVLHSPAPTVNFSAPPFNPVQFDVDQVHNFIGIKNFSNSVLVASSPLSVTFLTGTNYLSISTAGALTGYVLTVTNGMAMWLPNGGGGGGGSLSYNFNTNDFIVASGTNISLAFNIPRTNQNNTFYPSQTFAGGLFLGTGAQSGLAGSGAGYFANNAFNWNSSGDVNLTSVTGVGSGLTALNGTQITSGTVPVARLPVATTSTLGVLRPDNVTITISGGIITTVGSSSTVTNITGGPGIIVTNIGGTNFVYVSGIVVTNAAYTNSGTSFLVSNNVLFWNTNGFGGGSSGITALTGDVTASGPGSAVATLANIPTSTPMAGSLFSTAIVSPATPASGKGQIYEDSTSKNLAIKSDDGVIKHAVQTRTATTSQWIRSIADDGSSTISQPAFTDISGAATIGQLPTGVLTNFSTFAWTNLAAGISYWAGTVSAVAFNGNGNALTLLNGSAVATGTVAAARLGSGTPTSGTVLFGDNSWAQIQAGNIGTNGSSSGQVLTSVNGITDWRTPSNSTSLTPAQLQTVNTAPTNSTLTADSNPSIINQTIYIPSLSQVLQGVFSPGYFRWYSSGAGFVNLRAVGLAAGNINNDGWNDVIATRSGNTSFQVFTNGRNGLFPTQMTFTLPASATGSIGIPTISDVNGDGYGDLIIPLVTGGNSTNTVCVFTNAGAATAFAQLGTNYYAGLASGNPLAVAAADLNADGSQDFVEIGQQFCVYTNNGSGTFALSWTNVPSGANQNFGNVLIADANGDGRPDLFGTFGSGTINYMVVYTNSGLGQFGIYYSNNIVPATDTQPYLAVADINGDTRPDYVWQAGLAVNHTLYAFTNTGNGSSLSSGFAASGTNVMAANKLTGTILTDVNLDGFADEIVYLDTANLFVTLTNNKFGSFTAFATNSGGSVSGNSVIIASDVNGDTRPDVIQASSGAAGAIFGNVNAILGIYQGDGGGVTNALTLSSGNSSAYTPGSLSAGITTPGNIQLNTNFLSFSAARDSVANGNLLLTTNKVLMVNNTNSPVTFNSLREDESQYNTNVVTLGSLTIALPSTMASGQILRYTTAGIVTTVTVTGTVQIGAAITSLTANQSVSWQGSLTSGAWIRIQ